MASHPERPLPQTAARLSGDTFPLVAHWYFAFQSALAADCLPHHLAAVPYPQETQASPEAALALQGRDQT